MTTEPDVWYQPRNLRGPTNSRQRGTGLEFNKQPFTRSWIFGVYDGKVMFYEEMVTRAYLLSKPNTCAPIKAPRAVAQRGFYPTVSCVRHESEEGDYIVSMGKFVFREASPPEPTQASK